MIRMIATDLDNTMLRNDRNFTDYAVSVLNRCREAGVKIVFVTARSRQASERILKQFTPDIFIGYGGSVVTAGETIVRRAEIPAVICERLIRDSLAAPAVEYIHATNESIALTNKLYDGAGGDFSHFKYSDFTNPIKEGFLKITLCASDPAVVEAIAARYPSCEMMRYTGENLYRFANKEATKWNAVKAAAAYFDIDTNDVAAFGDDVNDAEMVGKCGAGVAVANAVEAVKKAAKHICGPYTEDGAARWIDKNILSSYCNLT